MPAVRRRRPDGAGRERLEHGVLRLLCGRSVLESDDAARNFQAQNRRCVALRLRADSANGRAVRLGGDAGKWHHRAALHRVFAGNAAHSPGDWPGGRGHHSGGAGVFATGPARTSVADPDYRRGQAAPDAAPHAGHCGRGGGDDGGGAVAVRVGLPRWAGMVAAAHNRQH